MADNQEPDVSGQSKVGVRFIPNGQSSTSTIGGALAVVFVSYMHTRGVDYPAGVEVSIGVITMAVAGYLHDFLNILLERLKRG